MELYDVKGQGLVRYFKVRWEGDWPPEQNPTWEPEENIPDDLVREFCLTFKPKPNDAPERRRARDDALGEENELPTLSVEGRDENDKGPSRPSSAMSGMFVYSSNDAMQDHVWDAPNSQGQRPNLNRVFPAPME
ncbi:hypothetical protein NLG97_g8384 [Lecanicillium saksenae]|uniref:Uncharacterized protein n=1 Tax=Lecanicillium saksenae TaxID=468837 RepID=A0ACC1QJ30_9HYPO|nr:hypothetical protein NLG97_g8384 [Lecanicillium saksenae]